MLDHELAQLAQEKGITTHIFVSLEEFANSLGEQIKQASSLGLIEDGREIPCYVVRIEKLFSPVYYDPPASRQVILAHRKEEDEWVLIGSTWFAGFTDMVLASHLYADELELIVKAVQKISKQAKIRLHAAVEIRPISRKYQTENTSKIE